VSPVARSGRRPGFPGRPPTPPYVRFRIRRFMTHVGDGASHRAYRRDQDGGNTREGPPTLWPTRRRSTKDHDRCTRWRGTGFGPTRAASARSGGSGGASTAAKGRNGDDDAPTVQRLEDHGRLRKAEILEPTTQNRVQQLDGSRQAATAALPKQNLQSPPKTDQRGAGHDQAQVPVILVLRWHRQR
jgi:hypothetical protein